MLLRILCVLIGPALFVAVEIGLRLAGLPQSNVSDAFYDSNFTRPLYNRQRLPDGTENYVAYDPKANMWPRIFPCVKSSKTLRIAVVGGSSPAGYPFSKRLSFCEWFKSGLEAVYPDKRIEVLNCAFPGRGLSVAIVVVRKVLEYEPDAIVVFSGNNEYREHHNYRAVRQRSGVSRFLYWVADHLATVRCLRQWIFGRQPSFNWQFVAENRTIPSDAGSDAEFELIVGNYAYGLNVIAQEAARKNVPVVFCTVPVNTRDWMPYASAFSRPLSESEKQACARKTQEAAKMLDEGREAEALELCRSFLAQDDRPALWHYLIARAYEKLNHGDLARQHYWQALELDVVRLRAFGSLNDAVRSLCARSEHPLADCVQALNDAGHGTPPGYDFFFDNCHPRFNARRVIALEMARALIASGKLPAPGPQWRQQLEAGMDRFEGQIQLSALEIAKGNLRSGKAILEGLTFRFVRQDMLRAEQHLREALATDDTLYSAHFYMGVIHFLNGRVEQATDEWKRELALHPSLEMARSTLQSLENGTLRPESLLRKPVFNLPDPE